MRQIYFLQKLSNGCVYQFDLSVFQESSHYEAMYYVLFSRTSECKTASELYDLLCVLFSLLSGPRRVSNVIRDNYLYFKQLYGAEYLRCLVKEIRVNFKYLVSTNLYYNLNPHVYGVHR